MLIKLVFCFAAFTMVSSVMMAADLSKYTGKAPRVTEQAMSKNVSPVFNTANYSKAATLTYVAVDSTSNIFGAANVYCNPIAYDPYSNVVVIVHRSKSTYAGSTIGSGGIYYAFSSDGGSTWTKRRGPMNGGVDKNSNGRFPSITLYKRDKDREQG
jgi:hypothetical protein